jgi:hypothetical protein
MTVILNAIQNSDSLVSSELGWACTIRTRFPESPIIHRVWFSVITNSFHSVMADIVFWSSLSHNFGGRDFWTPSLTGRDRFIVVKPRKILCIPASASLAIRRLKLAWGSFQRRPVITWQSGSLIAVLLVLIESPAPITRGGTFMRRHYYCRVRRSMGPCHLKGCRIWSWFPTPWHVAQTALASISVQNPGILTYRQGGYGLSAVRVALQNLALRTWFFRQKILQKQSILEIRFGNFRSRYGNEIVQMR